MSRGGIKLQTALRQELNKQISYGKSKHKDKKATRQDRQKLKSEMEKQGCSANEIKAALKNIDYTKDNIYWSGTVDKYTKYVGYFSKFVQKETGTERTDLANAKKYIQPYIDSLVDKGLSASTINTYLSGITKAFGESNSNYTHPVRHYTESRRGGDFKAINDEKNQRNHADILDCNKILGVRRKELGNIKLADFKYSDRGLELHSTGKGGKRNINIISKIIEIEVIEDYMKIAKAEGRNTLFSKQQLRNDADLHSCRADRAKTYYNHLFHRQPYRLHHKQLLRRLSICCTSRGPPSSRRGQAKRYIRHNWL